MAESQNALSASVSGSESKRDRSKKARTSAPSDVPVNAIDFSTRPITASAGGTPGVERAKSDVTDGDGRRPRKSARAKSSTEKAIPDTVRERFIQIGSNFFFPDGAEAFTDHGNRITTRSENAVVIQSMVAIAQARAASAVTVTGTDLFKKEAWFAARLVGLEVAGYTPTALEQERLVRAIARRRTAEKENVAPSPNAQNHEPPGRVQGVQTDTTTAAGERSLQGELIVGRLVDHGPARYQHKPTEPMSYYVRIETERGDRVIWGVDLERAFRQSLSTPARGDEVGLRAIGRDPVTVIAPKYDGSGREIGREELGAHRNQWLVERKDFLDRRRKMAEVFRDSSVTAAEAVKQYPELEGSYLQLQVARAGIEQRIANREGREQFVDHLRAHLAKTIEYGQPLEPVHLKARDELMREQQSVEERDYVPTR